MKRITTLTIVTAIAPLMIAGSAMAGEFPCTKAQFWITSLPTVPAGAEMHRDAPQINIAALTLKPRSKTRVAAAKAALQGENI